MKNYWVCHSLFCYPLLHKRSIVSCTAYIKSYICCLNLFGLTDSKVAFHIDSSIWFFQLLCVVSCRSDRICWSSEHVPVYYSQPRKNSHRDEPRPARGLQIPLINRSRLAYSDPSPRLVLQNQTHWPAGDVRLNKGRPVPGHCQPGLGYNCGLGVGPRPIKSNRLYKKSRGCMSSMTETPQTHHWLSVCERNTRLNMLGNWNQTFCCFCASIILDYLLD